MKNHVLANYVVEDIELATVIDFIGSGSKSKNSLHRSCEFGSGKQIFPLSIQKK